MLVSYCPVIVNLIERHYPELIPMLAGHMNINWDWKRMGSFIENFYEAGKSASDWADEIAVYVTPSTVKSPETTLPL